MVLVFDYWFTNIVAIGLVIAVGLISYYKSAFKYWKKRNVPHNIEPEFPFGTLPNPFRVQIHLGNSIKDGYLHGKSQGLKHAGGYLFTTPKYLAIDPEYIKNIIQRDFNYFTDRGFYYNEKDDPLSANLFALGGEKWRVLRTKLSPAFTSGKLKTMFDDILRCSSQMQDAVDIICQNRQSVNMKDISECFTIDVIGSCAFGLECNSFKNPEAEFRKQGKKIFFFPILRTFETCFAFACPKIARWLGIRLFDKDTTDFFINVVKDALHYRKSNNFARKDFLQLLLELGDDENKQKFTIEELTAQVFIFFAAGFETSSLTLTYCLYELAKNAEIQNKAREEVNRVLKRHHGKITYDAIMDMKYTNQVVEETLRKYPPVPFITRVCVKDYKVPDTKAIMEKGIDAVISILGLHHDPEYYPDPEKFDPERFSDENKRNRHPFTYMPFGEGPRMCIGLRFGLMQTKVGLLTLLKNYSFTLNEKTEVPLQIEPFSFTLIPKSGIFLDVKEVSE